MEKVIIIGCPGSGKSTFGRKLKRIIGLPLYHLDMMFWNEDRTTVSKETFIRRLQEVVNNSKWIIDGNIIFKTRTESEEYLSLLKKGFHY